MPRGRSSSKDITEIKRPVGRPPKKKDPEIGGRITPDMPVTTRLKKGPGCNLKVVCASGELTLNFSDENLRDRARKYIRARVSRGLVAEDVIATNGKYDLLDVCYLYVADS